MSSMSPWKFCIPFFPILLLILARFAAADEAISHAMAVGDFQKGRVLLVDRGGHVTWEYPAPEVCDLQALKNGNLLFNVHHGVLEVTRAKEVVLRYASESDVFSCRRLSDGTTLVAEPTLGQLIILDSAGKILRTVPLLQPGEKGGRHLIANARQTPDGHFLVAMYALDEIREYDVEGRILKRFPAPGGGRAAVRLPNGNLLIGTADHTHDPHIRELGADGSVLWDVSNCDLPGRPLRFVCGLHRLPNGNTVIANWLGHGQMGKAPHLLEITSSKKVVWTWSDHETAKAISTVQVLDPGVTDDLR